MRDNGTLAAESLISDALRTEVVSMRPLPGGCVSEVYAVQLADGRKAACKVERGDEPGLDIEAFMVRELGQHVATPHLIATGPRVLAMGLIEHDGVKTESGEATLGEWVARLHGVSAEAYGFGCDTRIGPIRLSNGWSRSWASFYLNKRVRPMAELAIAQGRLDPVFLERLDRSIAPIKKLLSDCPEPALIHGDLWAGNVLWLNGEPEALIDPSVCYADPEFELAFVDLMGNMGPSFWEKYESIRPIREGFWKRRRYAYRLFPLLVHAALFGGGYGDQAIDSLRATLGRGPAGR